MSDMDLNKLKVVELKAELQQRGLDTKGLKPVLIERLKEAIEKETEPGQPGDAAQAEGSNNGGVEDGKGGDAEAEPEEEELDEEAEEAMLAEDQGPEVQEPEPVEETSKPEPKVADAAAAPPQQPAPVQSPPKAPVQSPPKAPVQSPAKAPLQSPQKVEPPVVQQSPPKAPVVVPPQSPTKTPVPLQSPTKTPVPQQSPTKTPVPQQSPSKTPVPLQSPVKTPVPVQSPVKTPVPQQSPQKTAEALPAKQEPVALMKKEVADPVAAKSPVKVAEVPVQAEQIKTEPMQTDDKVEKPEVKKEEERGKKRPHSPEAVKEVVPTEDEPEYDESKCLLSWFDSDLNLVIDKTDLLKAEPMTKLGFAYCWAGARASYGVKQGKAFFEVMIDKYLEVSHLENEANPNVLRVGWSVPSSSMQLGEEEHTYGYGGTGKISTNCQFSDYGKPFQEGSVVGAFLDMSGETVTMSYSLDGEDLGVAFTVPKSELKGEPLFPHILTKNTSFSCNFGQDEPWFPASDNSFSLISKLTVDQDLVQGLKRPASKEECEVIMMVGVPACGKSLWAEKHAADNKQKFYTVLGTNNLIDKMKVMGLPRRKNYSGRWEELISTCTSCFNKLISVAATRRRNYILDQTNVYASARARKMQPFKGFNRVAVVVVPSEEDLKKRTELQSKEEGKDVPNNSVLEMKANFVVPTKGDIFEEVRFVELSEEEAVKMIEQYVKEANAAGVFKKDDTKHARFEQKPNVGGYRSNSGNTNSRYHSGNSNSRYGTGGGSGGGGGGGDFRNQRFQGGGGGGGGFPRRDNREGFRGASGGGGFRGASGGGDRGGGAWRGGRDNRDTRDVRGFGARQDFSRRGGGAGDFRRDQKDYTSGRDRGYNSRPGGERDRRDRYGGSGGGSNWSGTGTSNYSSSGGYGAGGNSSYASYGGSQQRGYNQNQYSGYSSYSSYPAQQQQQQQSYGSQSNAAQNWTYGTTAASAQQPQQQQQSYSGGWQQYGQGGYGSQAAQTQQSYQQQGYTGYQQNQSSGNYSTAQK